MSLPPACLALLLAGSLQASAPAPSEPAFSIRIVAPQPLYLVGSCHVEAAAIDASGKPYGAISYMTLSVDGRQIGHDARPPYQWDLEMGADLGRHRLEVEAVSRDGARASMSILSSTHPYVEAVGVNLVLVPVVVFDGGGGGAASGKAVAGLTQSDFTVLEGGVAQPLASFSSEPIPSSIVVALDNSRSMEPNLMGARRAVSDFVMGQPAYSAVSLLTFNDQVFMEQDFTHDPRQLISTLAAARSEGTRTALYEALRVGSMHLARRPGVRVLVLFTDGEDTLDEAGEGRLRTAIDAAQAADVTVFAVAFGRADAVSLGKMTSETGGEVVAARGAGELKSAFARIGEALGSRYILGYEPPDPGRAGYRDIEVRVSRQGARVLARRGYTMRPTGPASPDTTH